jgi:hypothetical protein
LALSVHLPLLPDADGPEKTNVAAAAATTMPIPGSFAMIAFLRWAASD